MVIHMVIQFHANIWQNKIKWDSLESHVNCLGLRLTNRFIQRSSSEGSSVTASSLWLAAAAAWCEHQTFSDIRLWTMTCACEEAWLKKVICDDLLIVLSSVWNSSNPNRTLDNGWYWSDTSVCLIIYKWLWKQWIMHQQLGNNTF